VTRAFLFAFAALFFAPPAFADCIYMGQSSSEGARICQVDVLAVCTEKAWVATKQSCSPPTVAPRMMSVEPAPMQPQGLGIHILTASYNSGPNGTDLTQSVRDICEGRPACGFTDDASIMGGTPMPRLPGRFSVMYECTNGFGSLPGRHEVYPGHAKIALSCRK
jgi:hypothetical protein